MNNIYGNGSYEQQREAMFKQLQDGIAEDKRAMAEKRALKAEITEFSVEEHPNRVQAIKKVVSEEGEKYGIKSDTLNVVRPGETLSFYFSDFIPEPAKNRSIVKIIVERLFMGNRPNINNIRTARPIKLMEVKKVNPGCIGVTFSALNLDKEAFWKRVESVESELNDLNISSSSQTNHTS